MVSVKVRPGETIDRALKRFRSQVKKAGIQQDARKFRHYVKPSEKKKLAKKRVERRNLKK